VITIAVVTDENINRFLVDLMEESSIGRAGRQRNYQRDDRITLTLIRTIVPVSTCLTCSTEKQNLQGAQSRI